MSVVMNKLGLLLLADDLVLEGGNIHIDLCQNNITPVERSVLTDFTGSTGIATFNGYAQGNVGPGVVSWDDVNGWAVVTWPQITFTKSAGGASQTIYCGYATYEDSDAVFRLLMHDIFSPAQTMANTGDAIKITPTLTLKP